MSCIKHKKQSSQDTTDDPLPVCSNQSITAGSIEHVLFSKSLLSSLGWEWRFVPTIRFAILRLRLTRRGSAVFEMAGRNKTE